MTREENGILVEEGTFLGKLVWKEGQENPHKWKASGTEMSSLSLGVRVKQLGQAGSTDINSMRANGQPLEVGMTATETAVWTPGEQIIEIQFTES